MFGKILTQWQSATKAETAGQGGPEVSRSDFLTLLAASLGGTYLPAFFPQSAAAQTGDNMTVTALETFYDVWTERFNSGDVDGLVALYETDVTHVNPQGETLVGNAAVRADFAGFLALKPVIDIHDRKQIVYGDYALSTNHWTITMNGEDGKPMELTGGGIEVLRKGADGGWRYIIDDASRKAIANG